MLKIIAGFTAGALLGSFSAANALPNYESKARELLSKYEITAETTPCGKEESMVSLYNANGAVFGATQKAIGLTEIAAYYKEMLCKMDNPATAKQDLTLDFDILASGGDGTILWAAGKMIGAYPSNGSVKRVPLRFTFIWTKDASGQYKISLMNTSVQVQFQP